MIFLKTFKGYEDRVAELDAEVNGWIVEHRVEVRAINTVLSHEADARSGSGDLLHVVVYKADTPLD